MKRNPNHPGALHLYIHLMESNHPDKAEAAADRCGRSSPGPGHMVHMPSHIYQRVGRYADAAKTNLQAASADEDYITQCRAQGLYPMAYYPHNVHFVWFAATMDGRGQLAVDSARKVAAKVSDEALKELPLLAGFRVVPYYALTRFGRWDEMLAEPAPPADNLLLTGIWHYARGLAFLAKGQLDRRGARARASSAASPPTRASSTRSSRPNTAATILAIAPEVLARRDRRRPQGLRPGRRPSRACGATGGRPRLHRAVGVALPAAPRPGGGAAGGGPGARSRDRLLGRPAAQPARTAGRCSASRRRSRPRARRIRPRSCEPASRRPGRERTSSPRPRVCWARLPAATEASGWLALPVGGEVHARR